MNAQEPARYTVYAALTEPMTPHQIADTTGLTMSRVYHALRLLNELGWVHKVRHDPPMHPTDKPRGVWARKSTHS